MTESILCPLGKLEILELCKEYTTLDIYTSNITLRPYLHDVLEIFTCNKDYLYINESSNLYQFIQCFGTWIFIEKNCLLNIENNKIFRINYSSTIPSVIIAEQIELDELGSNSDLDIDSNSELDILPTHE